MFVDSIANKFHLNFTITVLRFIAIVAVSIFLYLAQANPNAWYGIFFFPWMLAGLLALGILLWFTYIKKETPYIVAGLSLFQLIIDTLLFALVYFGALRMGVGGFEMYFFVPLIYSVILFHVRVPAFLGWGVTFFLFLFTFIIHRLGGVSALVYNPLWLSFGFVGTVTSFISEQVKAERTEFFKTKEFLKAKEKQIDELKRAGSASEYLLSGAKEKLGKVDEAKSEFITLLTHELRTPIAAVHWILESLAENSGARDLLEKGTKSIDRVNLIIDRINNAGTESPYIFTKEPLDTFLRAILDNFSAEIAYKKLGLSLAFPQSLPQIEIDRDKFRIAVEEVIENAITFTPEGGKISIGVDDKEANSSRGALTITVADTGIGIPQVEREKIFEKFYRGTRAQKINTDGTGLGLYMANNIVKKHGGMIWFEENPGGGTVFNIRIPLYQLRS